jgi:hypothetical protein
LLTSTLAWDLEVNCDSLANGETVDEESRRGMALKLTGGGQLGLQTSHGI